MSYFFKWKLKIYFLWFQIELEVVINNKLCTGSRCLLSSQSMSVAWWSPNRSCFVIIALLPSSEGTLGVCHYHTDSSILGFERHFCDMLRILSFLGLVTSSSSDFSMERNNGEIGRPYPQNPLPAIATLGEAN